MGEMGPKVVYIILGLVVAAIILVPFFNDIKDDGVNATTIHSGVSAAVADGGTTSGNAVKASMRQATRNGQVVTGSSGMVKSAGDKGQVKFSDTGAFESGKLYVVVSYMPKSDGAYVQTNDPSVIKDNGFFTEERLYDANGKLNRISYIQVANN